MRMHSVVFLHINNKCVCEVAQRPSSFSTDIWRSIIEGSEDGVCCVRHKHHILKQRERTKFKNCLTDPCGSETCCSVFSCSHLSQTGEQYVDSQSPDGCSLHQIVFTVGQPQQHGDAHQLSLILKKKKKKQHYM